MPAMNDAPVCTARPSLRPLLSKIVALVLSYHRHLRRGDDHGAVDGTATALHQHTFLSHHPHERLRRRVCGHRRSSRKATIGLHSNHREIGGATHRGADGRRAPRAHRVIFQNGSVPSGSFGTADLSRS